MPTANEQVDPNDPFVAGLADRYRIERTLGAGGMATVYLAEDVKHRRKVAVKVLHPELSAVLGPDRFVKEIELTANLQHPHILPLFDSGSANGLLYYVMPYVDGETLRARLEREGQLPVEDALRIASESADALHYAHQHDIVHRDIKPENILLQNGHALVADFGIALAVKQAGGQRMTQTGLSLGTPQYMSPEQAMGDKQVDARTDTYALGAVTYEMLAGQPPFTGPSGQAIIAKVITEKAPSVRELRPAVSPGVDAAVARALEKLPADRWQTTERFAEALMRPSAAVATDAAATTAHIHNGKPAYGGGVFARNAIAATLAAALIAAAWWLGHRSATQAAPWSEFTQLTDASGVETSPSLSPDGQSFAYASNARGTWDIYVQRVGGRNSVIVAGDSTADEQWPAYSPDGHDIAYGRNGSGIFVVGATGESPRRLTSFGSNPAWSPDGQSIVFGTEEVTEPYSVDNVGQLWVVSASGSGAPRRLDPKLSGHFYQPAWSPSGKRIAFWVVNGGQRDIATMAASGGDGVLLTNDAAVDWAPVW
ncbi:MAG: protein kinase, partial [Gemmatimonadaceae bacterium]